MASSFGIIVPGPELRQRIDRAAKKIAEKPVIREKLLNSDRRDEFLFLLESNEFHAYYTQMVQEYKSAAPTAAEASTAAASASDPKSTTAESGPTFTGAADAGTKKPAADVSVLTSNPHPEHYSLQLPSISAVIDRVDLEVMRLAALYAAKSGDGFVERLRSSGGAAKRGLECIDPTHPRHKCFLALRASYERVLQLPEEAYNDLLQVTSTDGILKVCQEQKRYQEMVRDRERTRTLTESELSARLLWNDFTVLGRFSLREFGLDPSCKPASAGRKGTTEGKHQGIAIVEDYVAPKSVVAAQKMALRDAQTGQIVDADEATSHVRAQTTNVAKAAADRQKAEKRLREESGLADDDEMKRNLASRFSKDANGGGNTSGGGFEVNPE